jgi:hypothetical protein
MGGKILGGHVFGCRVRRCDRAELSTRDRQHSIARGYQSGISCARRNKERNTRWRTRWRSSARPTPTSARVASRIVLIGKESNRLDEVEAGLHGDWREILADYEGRNSQPSYDILYSIPATVIAMAWGRSVRIVRTWRRNSKLQTTRDK